MNIDSSKIKKCLIECSTALYDKDFLFRVYNEELKTYEEELIKRGGAGNKYVLDAGCGFGQWSLALSLHNMHVHALDISKDRIDFFNILCEKLGIKNVTTQVIALENFSDCANKFDYVLCYGTLYLASDWQKSLSNLINSTKQNGKIHVMLTGLGYYINLWDNEKNKSATYEPRKYAFETLVNTYAGYKMYSQSASIISFESLEILANTLGCKVEKSSLDDKFYDAFYNGLSSVYWVEITKC